MNEQINPIKIRELKMLLEELQKPHSGLSFNLAFRIIVEALLELAEKKQNEEAQNG